MNENIFVCQFAYCSPRTPFVAISPSHRQYVDKHASKDAPFSPKPSLLLHVRPVQEQTNQQT